MDGAGRETRSKPDKPASWVLWLLGSAALVACALAVNFLGRHAAGVPFSWTFAGQWALDWSLWGALAPGIVWLARRFPIDRDHWVVGVGRQVVLGTVVSLAQLLVFTVAARHLFAGPEAAERSLGMAYGFTVSLWLPYALLIYATITIATHVIVSFRREGAREVEAAVLREQLSRTQLHALRMQLHPHFLFNTLNTISVFLDDGRSEEAGRIVLDLGKLLGRSLDSMGRHEVTLGEELTFIRRYLAIERRRFADRLTVRIAADPEATAAYVPNMILQPLVENAMRHGIQRDPSAGRLSIEVRRRGDQLFLTIRDDGPGFGALRRRSNGRGMGLSNTVRRLEELYGEDASLGIRAGDPRGTVVELRIPYRKQPIIDQAGERNP